MDVVAQHYLDALEAVADDDEDIRRSAETSLVRAGERSLRSGAQLRAGRSFARAAELRSGTAAAELWERAGLAFGAAAHFDEAVEALAHAQDLYERGGGVRAAAGAKARAARFVRRRGQLVEAGAMLDEALAVLRTDPDGDTVLALQEATSVASFLGRPGGRELIDEALGIAQAIDLPGPQIAPLFVAAGIAAQYAGRRVEAEADLRHAAVLAERAGDLTTLAFARGNLGSLYLPRDFAKTAESMAAACEIARRAGEAYILATSTFSYAAAELFRGDWQSCRTIVDSVEIESEFVDLIRVVLLTLTGDLDGATAAATLADLRASADWQDVAAVAWVDGLVAEARGRTQVGLDHLLDGLNAGLSSMWDAEAAIWSWAVAARLAVGLGRLDVVRALVELAEGAPPGRLPVLVRAGLWVVRAQLGVQEGLPVDEVDALFDDGLTQLRAAGSPYHLAHALLDRAEHLAATGRDATAMVDEALLISERLGAVDIARRLGDRVLTSPAG